MIFSQLIFLTWYISALIFAMSKLSSRSKPRKLLFSTFIIFADKKYGKTLLLTIYYFKLIFNFRWWIRQINARQYGIDIAYHAQNILTLVIGLPPKRKTRRWCIECHAFDGGAGSSFELRSRTLTSLRLASVFGGTKVKWFLLTLNSLSLGSWSEGKSVCEVLAILRT